jgi:hypothetical protein
MNDQIDKQKLWKIYGILIGIMIGGAILIIGGQTAWNAIQENASRSTVESKPTSSNSALPNVTSSITPNSLKESSSIQLSPTPNLFENVAFPLPTCGDNMPTDPKDYPVNFYPVFIDFTKNNLQVVKSRFCQDSYQLVRESTGKDAIQVASFTSIDRAEAFKKIMINFFGSAEIGQPRTVKSK